MVEAPVSRFIIVSYPTFGFDLAAFVVLSVVLVPRLGSISKSEKKRKKENYFNQSKNILRLVEVTEAY